MALFSDGRSSRYCGYKILLKNLPLNLGKDDLVHVLSSMRTFRDEWYRDPLAVQLYSAGERISQQAVLTMNSASDASLMFQTCWDLCTPSPRDPSQIIHVTVDWAS